MTQYTYDHGKRTKAVYSPLFSSDSVPLAEGAEFRVSLVITRRVEPISYSLLSAIGGLGPDDTESSATVVVHFKNDSQQTYRISLKEISVMNQKFNATIPEVVLKPRDRFDTEPVPVKAPTYNVDFELTLNYKINGKFFSQSFLMKRRTIEELKREKIGEKVEENNR
jgi:hypothetical protein